MRKTMKDTSGGAYFYLDQLDRAVVGTADGAIEIDPSRRQPEGPRLELEERMEFGCHLRAAQWRCRQDHGGDA